MNIKEHIEAGHYPKDDKGRALVPIRDGGIATICATDKPGRSPLLGWRSHDDHHMSESWPADGQFSPGSGDYGLSLLPPPPRKVEVKRWISDRVDSNWAWTDYAAALHWANGRKERIVELTGSYEEPWE